MKLRVLVLGIVGIAAIVAAATFAYLAVSKSGWTVEVCDVTATRIVEEGEATVLSPSLVASHPPLREALEEALSAEIGHARLSSCQERDDLASVVEGVGARPDPAEGGYRVEFNGTKYRLDLRRAVA